MATKAAQSISGYLLPATTLTPFLYQTRTLSNLRKRPSRVSSGCRRTLTSSTPLQYSRDGEDSTSGKSTITSDTTTWSPLNTPAPSNVSQKQTTLPAPEQFESQATTWSIKRRDQGTLGRRVLSSETRSKPYHSAKVYNSSKGIRPSREQKTWDATKCREGTHKFGARSDNDNDFADLSQGIHFDEDFDENWVGGKDEISELTRSQPLGESTITDSERYAFQKVFKDIFGKTQSTGVGVSDNFESSLPAVDVDIKSRTNSGLPTTQKMSRWELEEMVNRYPAPLRAAAARAIGLHESDIEGEEEASENEPELDLERLETLREPERKRVETLMKAAETDFELWDVMEREVFSLIRTLGLEDVVKTTPPQKVKSKKKKSAQNNSAVLEEIRSPEQSSQLQSFTVNEEGISHLALYGPLYPSYLLLGLRLLDRHFSKSSSLTLALLPKIKSLGLISHVLGASSQLYNELLQIHRYRYDDYRGIVQLLGEMEHGGIEFDQETLEIVKDIQRTQLSVRKGEKGEAIQMLWNLPEFAPNKFKVWLDKIAADISSRETCRRTTVTY